MYAQTIHIKVSFIGIPAIPLTTGLVADFDFSNASTTAITNHRLTAITDANSNIVSSQSDTTKQPIYHLNGGAGNNAYATFNGSDILSGANIDTSSSYTLFIVRRVNASSGVNAALFQSGSASGNGFGWVDYEQSSGGYKFSGGFPAAQAPNTFFTSYNRNEVVVLSHSHDSTAQYNISNVKFVPSGRTSNPTSPSGGHNIGYYNFAGITKGTFDATRIILYNRQLSDSEVATVNAFLKTRYIIKPPYNYIGDGDSITFGTGGEPNYVTECGIDLTPTQNMYVRNTSLSGQNINDILTYLTARVVNYYQPGVKNVYSLMIGRNGLESTSPDTIYNKIKTVASRVHAAGYKFIIMTMLYTTNVSEPNTLVNTFNDKIRADHSFADGFLDANQITNLTDPTNTTYYADGTHITSAGAQLIANQLETIISGL